MSKQTKKNGTRRRPNSSFSPHPFVADIAGEALSNYVPEAMLLAPAHPPIMQRDTQRDEPSNEDSTNVSSPIRRGKGSESAEDEEISIDGRREFMENKAEEHDMLRPFYHKFSIEGAAVADCHRQGLKRLDYIRANPNWNLQYVLSGGVNRYVEIHNYYTGAPVGRLLNTDSSDGAWSQCGEYFIFCGADSVTIADVGGQSGQPTILRSFSPESAPAGARFAREKNIAVVALKSGAVCVFDERVDRAEPAMTARGLPEVTCVDTNPDDWGIIVLGCKNGMVKELNFLEPHKQSGRNTSHFQYFIPREEGSKFGCFPGEEYNGCMDGSEVKSVRYCTSHDSVYYHDIVVTKANGGQRWNEGGDAAYKFTPGKDKLSDISSVVTYLPPEGLNLSCATLAFSIKYGVKENYVVAGTEEGIVVVFDAYSGKPIRDGITRVEEMCLPDVNLASLPTSYVPIRKAQEETSTDPQPETRITAIDVIPDMRVGAFLVGGHGVNPTIDVFRFQEEDGEDIDPSLFVLD